jgi:transketolase
LPRPGNNLHGSSKEAVERGAYVLQPGQEGDPPPQLVLVGTGSEVQLIIQAAAALQERARVRVVSMPCWELFDEQPME